MMLESANATDADAKGKIRWFLLIWEEEEGRQPLGSKWLHRMKRTFAMEQLHGMILRLGERNRKYLCLLSLKSLYMVKLPNSTPKHLRSLRCPSAKKWTNMEMMRPLTPIWRPHGFPPFLQNPATCSQVLCRALGGTTGRSTVGWEVRFAHCGFLYKFKIEVLSKAPGHPKCTALCGVQLLSEDTR
jgi:hypothetical protein